MKKKCNDIIDWNTQELFKSTDFLECDRETLIYILKLETLNCNETEVFDAGMKWARAECKRLNIDDGNVENLRTALGDAFFAIRIGLMTIAEFANIQKLNENLFTMTELTELLQQIGKVNESKSHLFINRPRTQCYVYNIKEDSGASFIPSNGFDVVYFYCNKLIDLNGFVMSAGPCDDFDVSVIYGTTLLIK